jgi:hypothetical protein
MLAASAFRFGRESGIDQGHLILSYAKEHDDWMKATQALRFLPQAAGAIDVLRERFMNNIDFLAITAESSEHLLAMQGFAE